MTYFEIKCEDQVVAKKAKLADTFVSRAIGLMFSRTLGESDALIIDPTNSIHTCFMNYEIDVIFLNRKNEIVKVIHSMRPWRMTRPYFKASKVIELRGGTFPFKSEACEGKKLEFKCLS